MNLFIHIKKCTQFLVALTLTIIGSSLQAQVVEGTITDTTKYVSGYDPARVTTKCDNPTAPNINVVQYATKAVAEISIKANGVRIDNLAYGIKGEGQTTPLRANDGASVVLDNLQKNQTYQIKGFNSCGASVVIAEFTTYPFRPGEDEIRVSDALYRRISLYTAQKEGAMPLNQYIESLPDVSVQEKTFFLQAFLMKGRPLPNTMVGKLPTTYVREVLDLDPKDNDGETPSPCICEFVVNQGAYAVPDQIEGNHSINRFSEYYGDKFGASSRWWWDAKEGGPAKYQQIATDGWKENWGEEKGRIFERGASSETTNMSPNFAKMSYTFLCVNFPAATPSECGCDKKISISAEYTSKINLRATTRSGGGLGKKKSWARASDFATLMVVKNNATTVSQAVEIVQTGSNVFSSSCEGGVAASEVLGAAADIVGSVTSVIAAVNTGQIQDIGQSSQALIASIASTFKLFEANKPCAPSIDAVNTLVQKSRFIVLKPNEPITVALLSGSRLEAGGQRSWDSHARIQSDFFLTGVLLGSNSATGEDHCCTDYSAQWVYATENRPVTGLTIPVNNFIFSAINGAGNITINGVPSVGSNFCGGTEIGHATADFPGCEKKVPIYTFQ